MWASGLLSKSCLLNIPHKLILQRAIRHLSQVSALTGLESLVLSAGSWQAEGLALCSAFTRLTSLEMTCVSALPPCLGDLTALERLVVVSRGRPDVQLRGNPVT